MHAIAARAIAAVVLRDWAEVQPRAERVKLSATRPTAVFESNPDMRWTSIERSQLSRPDGFARLKPMKSSALPARGGRYAVGRDRYPGGVSKTTVWHEINDVRVALAFGFYNKADTDCCQNNCKMMWSFTSIMRACPMRRFVFGYSIGNTHMRLWFLSRADLIVSEDFNYMTVRTLSPRATRGR